MSKIGLRAALALCMITLVVNIQAMPRVLVFESREARIARQAREAYLRRQPRPQVIVVKTESAPERSSIRDVAAAVDLAVNAYEYPALTAAVIGGLVVCAAAISALRTSRTDYVVVEESRPTTTTVYLKEDSDYYDDTATQVVYIR